MRKISTTEKSRMTTEQVSSLNDSCVIHTPTFTQDSLGDRTATWADSASIDCGINVSPVKKTYNGQIIDINYDALLRLPLTQTININNEVTVRSIRYKVYGLATGNGVQIIPLKLVVVND